MSARNKLDPCPAGARRDEGRLDPSGRAVVLTGPTASGKSRLALALADVLPVTVINADSMQVYRELAILTARPGPAELARAPHRLYGCLPGKERCSAGRWRDLAADELEAAWRAGRLPLLVGGTGFYLRALQHGLPRLPSVPETLRRRLVEHCAAIGAEAFHRELARLDPIMAGRLHPHDRQRTIRAREVLEATGRSLADWQAGEAAAPAVTPSSLLSLALVPPREQLYSACDARFRAMIEAGALDEVRALLNLGLDPRLPVMKALGVAELAGVLRGEQPLEAAIAAAQQATRRYAKRQLTWLRTQYEGKKLASYYEFEQFSERNEAEIFKIIREFLLTVPN